MAHARYVCIAIAALTMLTVQGPSLADFEPPEALHVLYDVAEHVCHARFGENHVISDETDAMKYYCQRLQHPIEFLQDQDWWKQHLPANLQAVPRPKELSPGEKRLQEFEKRNEGALARCKLNGGSGGDCWMCVMQRDAARAHYLPGHDLPVDPKCRHLFYTDQERLAFHVCIANGGTDSICETCSAPFKVHDPACRPYLDRTQMDRFERCQDLQCRICASSPLMARKPECAAYQ